MEWEGLSVAKHPDVYEPADDTFLLARCVAETARPGMRFLEVGCGAGLISMVAARAGATVCCSDMNPHAVALTRANARDNGLELDAREGDLLAGHEGPFDLVAFNPPYLPTGEDDHVEGPLDLAFDGGPDGNVVALRFAEALAALEPPAATVLVVHSSLSDPGPLVAAMKACGYTHEVAAEEALPYERIWVRRFRR